MTGEDDSSADSATDDRSLTTDENAPADAEESVPDVYTSPKGHTIKRKVPPEQWEVVGRRSLVSVLEHHQRAIDREIAEITSSVEYGTGVDHDFVVRLRDALANLEVVLEEDLVPLTGSDDLEPWEHTADRVPMGQLAAALGTDAETLADALDAVESDDE